MDLYKPSKLIALLKNLNKLPKKSLSQNFLIDGNILKKIIKTAQIQTGDTVLEIGPGPGSLTLALLNSQNQKNNTKSKDQSALPIKVIAVEKDKIFAQHLQDLKLDHLTVIEDDFLKTDLKKLFFDVTTKKLKPEKKAATTKKTIDNNQNKIKVVANLPYNITTPILFKLLENYQLFSSLTIMVQKEVAQRIVAFPKTKAYSSLTLFVKTYADPKLAFNVSPTSFYPQPSVKSAVVFFKLKKPFLKGSELKQWHQFVHRSFQQRRKKLTSSLKFFFPKEKIEQALTDLKLSLNSRPEELAFDQFFSLFKKLF